MINMPGGPEMVVIILVALIVLGPKELPRAMRTMGNVMAEIRKISTGFQAEMRSAMDSITDDGSTKPQSGSVPAATPAAAAPASPAPASPAPTSEVVLDPVDATGTEVVARNDGTSPSLTDGTSPAEGPARQPVDPADRAAG